MADEYGFDTEPGGGYAQDFSSSFDTPTVPDFSGFRDFAASLQIPQMPQTPDDSNYNVGTTVPPEWMSAPTAPAAPPPATPGMLDRAATGLGKEVLDSPLKAFGAALGLGATGLGVANQLSAQRALGKQAQHLERAEKSGEQAAATGQRLVDEGAQATRQAGQTGQRLVEQGATAAATAGQTGQELVQEGARATRQAGETGQRLVEQGTKAAETAGQTGQELVQAGRQGVSAGQRAIETAATPAVAFARQQLADAQAGRLPAAMEARIAEFVQKSKADMRARYASMGLGNSSNLASEEIRIDQQAETMRGQLLQQQEATALDAVRTAVAAGTASGQLGGLDLSAGSPLIDTGARSLTTGAGLLETGTRPLATGAGLLETGTRPLGPGANLVTTGTGTLPTGASLVGTGVTGVGHQAQQQQQFLTSLIADANRQLGLLGGRQS